MMHVIHMDVNQWSAWVGKLGSQFMPTVTRGMQYGAEKCCTFLKIKTEKFPPVSNNARPGIVGVSGHYKMAWMFSSLSDGVKVYNKVPYASIIEFGRRPGPVSKEGRANIQLWVQRKLGLSRDAAVPVAFAIARSMSKRPWGGGRTLHARPVMFGDLASLVRIVEAEITHELDRALGGP